MCEALAQERQWSDASTNNFFILVMVVASVVRTPLFGQAHHQEMPGTEAKSDLLCPTLKSGPSQRCRFQINKYLGAAARIVNLGLEVWPSDTHRKRLLNT